MDNNMHADTGTVIVIPPAVVHRGVNTTDVVIIVVLQALVYGGTTSLVAQSLVTILVTSIEKEAGTPLMILHQKMIDVNIIDVAVVRNPPN